MSNAIQCLLVDDDLDDQEIFCMALQQIDESIKCLPVFDGVHALEILRSDESFIPDFIFLDVNMPKMNGLICLAEIRQISRLNHSRIIMYSTTLDKKIIENSKERGADDFLVKPPGLTLLLEKLTGILHMTNA